jgi:hypothetical protein
MRACLGSRLVGRRFWLIPCGGERRHIISSAQPRGRGQRANKKKTHKSRESRASTGRASGVGNILLCSGSETAAMVHTHLELDPSLLLTLRPQRVHDLDRRLWRSAKGYVVMDRTIIRTKPPGPPRSGSFGSIAVLRRTRGKGQATFQMVRQRQYTPAFLPGDALRSPKR